MLLTNNPKSDSYLRGLTHLWVSHRTGKDSYIVFPISSGTYSYSQKTTGQTPRLIANLHIWVPRLSDVDLGSRQWMIYTPNLYTELEKHKTNGVDVFLVLITRMDYLKNTPGCTRWQTLYQSFTVHSQTILFNIFSVSTLNTIKCVVWLLRL